MSEVRLRPLAESDLVERVRHYRTVGDDELGERFFDAELDSLDLIGRMPGAGSPRIGELCGVSTLRSSRLDVVRLLAFAQDLTTVFGAIDDEW